MDMYSALPLYLMFSMTLLVGEPKFLNPNVAAKAKHGQSSNAVYFQSGQPQIGNRRLSGEVPHIATQLGGPPTTEVILDVNAYRNGGIEWFCQVDLNGNKLLSRFIWRDKSLNVSILQLGNESKSRTSGAMDAASLALEEGASVSVVIDRAEIPESSESGSYGRRQHPVVVLPPTVVEPSEGEVPGDSDRPPLVKARESSGTVEDETGKNRTVSSGVGDLEKGQVTTKTLLVTDSEATQSSNHQDNDEESQCRVCHMSTATADAINLGCNCKLDLGRVHKGCAEKWFKIRGNRTCEICGEIAQNVQLGGDCSCRADGQESVIVTNVQDGGDTRLLFLRSVGICFLWVALIIFLYKYLLPMLRKIHRSRQQN